MLAYAVLLLFFIQLLTAFVAANYSLGLLHNRLPPESASAVLLLSPLLLPVLERRRIANASALAAVVVAARLVYPLVDETRIVLLASGAGVAASLLLLAVLLRQGAEGLASTLAGALALAIAASIALRAIGSGVDVSTLGAGQVIALPLGAAALASWPRTGGALLSDDRLPDTGQVIVPCVGVLAAITVVYFGLSAPNVMARWTGESSAGVNAALLVALVAWGICLWRSDFRRLLTPGRLSAGTLLLTALLMLSLLPHQPGFPSDARVYPLEEPEGSAFAAVALVLALLISPIVIADSWVLVEGLRTLKPSSRQIAVGLSAGTVLLAALIFAQIFTTTYDYVPVLGPLFRDRFWAVIAAPTAVLGASLLALPPTPRTEWRLGAMQVTGLVALGVAGMIGVIMVRAGPEIPGDERSVTIATYNLQQGYDAANNRNFGGQRALLRSLDADVISVQESDTNRVAGGNDDLVRYLADGLEMYSYFGPKTVSGTFGVSLLSRYPIENPRTFYLFSEGEQKAVIAAQIVAGGRRFDVFVVHLGNGGPLVQQQELLTLLPSTGTAILAGDFNFRPNTRQYEETVRRLEDAWLRDLDADEDPARDRIDYVFLSPGTEVREARYIDSPESNHPVLIVEIGW